MTTVLRWVAGDKKAREKAIKAAVKYASECEPLVRTIQGGLETCDMKRAIGDITKTVDDVEGLVSKISDVAAKAIQFVPSMQIVGKSFADSAKIFASFSSIASAAGIGVNIVLAYQGLSAVRLIDGRLKDMAGSLAAQTALIAQRDFPQYVYDMISERVTQTSLDPNQDHWFFVYHPDNDWYPGFYRIMHDKPIGPAFCGYTNQIDTAFVFMLAARRRIEKKERRAQKEGRPIRPTKLHLLIPAYQPILILEALQIPEEIGDFVMEGRINSNKEFVWLSLPEQQRRYVQDIGHFAPPPQGFFEWAMSELGLADAPPKLGAPRILGTRQGLGPADEEVLELANGDEVALSRPDENVHTATPLQHRNRRHRKR